MSGAYYNENDPFAAAWLRELIKAGLIADGEVDERSIEQVEPTDLRGFTQCHFFAGIGVWSYALRNAGWPDDLAVWTGSCPCQGFSAAGKGEGFSDKRHLWPAWFRLISECRPNTVFGEQVASKDGLAWLDVVSADMEGAEYAIGTADLCAAGFGAPHIRQRLYFVADSGRRRREQRNAGQRPVSEPYENSPSRADGTVGVAQGDTEQSRLERFAGNGDGRDEPRRLITNETGSVTATGGDGSVVDPERARISRGNQRGFGAGGREVAQQENRESPANESGDRRQDAAGILAHTGREQDGQQQGDQGSAQPSSNRENHRLLGGSGSELRGATNGFWRDAEWIYCKDGKYRPVKPEIFPLATGVAGRVGLLRGAGNALCAEVAKGFIEAYLEVIGAA